MRRCLICATVAAGSLAPAHAQMGPNVDLSWSTIDGGGAASTGAAFTLTGTIGQPDAGTMTASSFELSGGFWGGGPPACYPDCNADSVLTVADFGCFQTKFVSGDPYADCNGDGVRTVADFGCFQTKFVAGCP
jgi:hypothetical protein